MNLRYLAMVFLLPATHPALADVYKWKDATGRVHYSDKTAGGMGAERVKTQNFVPSPSQPDGAGQPAAVRQKVTIYTRPDCGYCKQAKADLGRRGVPYIEQDIERSSQARREFDGMGGRGVPILLVGSQRMDGYSMDGLSELLTSGGY